MFNNKIGAKAGTSALFIIAIVVLVILAPLLANAAGNSIGMLLLIFFLWAIFH